MGGSREAVTAHADAVDEMHDAVRAFHREQLEVIVAAREALKQRRKAVAGEVHAREDRFRTARQRAHDAEAALKSCREGCDGPARALKAARRQEAEAEALLRRARQAEQIVGEAAHAFQVTASKVEAASHEHGNAAMEACRALAGRLREILSSSTTYLVGLEMLAAGANVGGQVSRIADVGETRPISIVEQREEDVHKKEEQYAEHKKQQYEEHAGDVDRENLY
jgi:hypothetical protein